MKIKVGICLFSGEIFERIEYIIRDGTVKLFDSKGLTQIYQIGDPFTKTA
jgi:hypothetical protein